MFAAATSIYNRTPARGSIVHTLYDWLAVAVFAGLVVLFLQRSMTHEEPKDNIFLYLPPAIGCAFANWVGNENDGRNGWLAGIILAVVVVYIFHILKPFPRKP